MEIGDTPLHLAVKTKNFKAIQILIEKNSSLNIKNLSNKTPLEIADEDTQKLIHDLLNKKQVS